MIKLPFLSPPTDFVRTKLFDEKTFYQQFTQDLYHAQSEVIIESPFITSNRMQSFTAIFQSLINKNIKIFVITRDPNDHEERMKDQAEMEIQNFETIGVQVFISTNHTHRKLAIIDRSILWEGSLNILSQSHSREFMRRIESKELATDCFNFTRMDKYIF